MATKQPPPQMTDDNDRAEWGRLQAKLEALRKQPPSAARNKDIGDTEASLKALSDKWSPVKHFTNKK